MARRARAGKSRQQGSSQKAHLTVVRDDGKAPARAPAMPRGLSDASKTRWRDFWASKLAAFVDPGADRHRLERWIKDVDEYDKLRKAYNRQRIVKGSQGQPRMNPIATRLVQLEKQIREVEDDFGMNPAARLKLGISFGEPRDPVAELNAAIDDDAGEDDDALAAEFADEG